jgi:hypothetical protein
MGLQLIEKLRMNAKARKRIASGLLRCPDALAVASVFAEFLFASTPSQAAEHQMPVIQEPWMQIAGDPNPGELTDLKQQPVDFGIWQAADGTWQLWSCIQAA